jgi:DNA-binding GntR family transcriptional regulator
VAATAAPPDAERRTAADEVYQALKRDIITLRLQPGASLTEQQLAAAYGTSRVPVREASRRLQQEGLLTAVPYKGYFVSQISLKEIGDCFDLRSILETYAVECAIERAPDTGLQQLESLALSEYTFHDWSSYAKFLERNLEFHLQMALLSDNNRLVNTLHDLLGSMQRFFFLGLDLGDFGKEMRNEHEELVDLMKSRSRQGATECVRDQITRSRERILRALLKGRFELPLR